MTTMAGARTAYGWLAAAQRVARARVAACVGDALRLGLAVLFAALLTACGGSDGDLGGPPAAAPAAPTAAPVARVEIVSDSAWLPGNGQSRQLAARALDAAGNPVSATISWTSSRASHVAVDASGLLTSQVAAGSAQITAQADGIVSAPLLAYVATPAAGVVLVDDASIVGRPVDTDPAAAPSAANTYQVTLDGIAPPAVGTLLLGRGDKPLAGRVTAVATTGGQTVATLQLVPLPELFAELEIEEVLDLSRAEVIVPPEVEAAFVVTRSGNTWSFAPRPAPTTARARAQRVTGTHASDILPFRNCEKSTPFDFESLTDLPIGFDPPGFNVTIAPSVDFVYSRRSGLTRFIVSAEPKVTISAMLKAEAALSGGLECTLQLFAPRIPIGGPMAFFVGGYLPVGVGFELNAAATLGSFKAGAEAEAGTTVAIGWNCPPAGPECSFVRSMDNSTANIEPKYEAPTLDGNARLEAGLEVFGYIEAELGNPFLRALRFKALQGRIGGRIDGSFETSAAQMLNLDYASTYGASLTASASTGIGVNDTLRMLGFETLTGLGIDVDVPLARSPRAQSVQADRGGFATGDRVNVKVALDPATLNFLPDTYNVKAVQLRRRVGGVSEVLSAQTASTGQKDFEFDVTAPNDGHVSSWNVFVVTRLIDADLLAVEVGQARGSSPGDLPPMPPGQYHMNDEVGFFIRLDDGTGSNPGTGDCEPKDREVTGPLPFTFNQQASCSLPEGTVTGRIEARHFARASGRVKMETRGRFQTDTSHFGSVFASAPARADQHFVILSPARNGQSGTATARFRVRFDGNVPSFLSSCNTCGSEANFVLDAPSGGGRMEERLYWRHGLPSAQQRPSIELQRDITIPINFTFGQPFPVDVKGGISLTIRGRHRDTVDSNLRIEYAWLFDGLPSDATVETSTGPVWPMPTE